MYVCPYIGRTRLVPPMHCFNFGYKVLLHFIANEHRGMKSFRRDDWKFVNDIQFELTIFTSCSTSSLSDWFWCRYAHECARVYDSGTIVKIFVYVLTWCQQWPWSLLEYCNCVLVAMLRLLALTTKRKYLSGKFLMTAYLMEKLVLLFPVVMLICHSSAKISRSCWFQRTHWCQRLHSPTTSIHSKMEPF